MPHHYKTRIVILSWLAALAGLWLTASPFILSGMNARNIPLADVVGGMLIVALSITHALYAKSPLFARLTAVTGLWVALTPWIFSFFQNREAKWNSLTLGVIVIVLAMASSLASPRPGRVSQGFLNEEH